jgi:uncharacterized Zn finger protein (UPF0148 family)
MVIKITCPICGFTDHIAEESIQVETGWATCPNCGNSSELLIQDKEQDQVIEQGGLKYFFNPNIRTIKFCRPQSIMKAF